MKKPLKIVKVATLALWILSAVLFLNFIGAFNYPILLSPGDNKKGAIVLGIVLILSLIGNLIIKLLNQKHKIEK